MHSTRWPLLSKAQCGVAPREDGSRIYGQTVGELVDSMIVLQRKVNALMLLQEESRLQEHRRKECAVHLTLCLRKAQHLARVAEQLSADVLADYARLPPRADPKLYRLYAMKLGRWVLIRVGV